MNALNGFGETHDAIIIGGGVEGLVAAAYLSQAGRDVVLVEAGPGFGGDTRTAMLDGGYRAPLMPHVCFTPDSRVVENLNLQRFGLQFARRDARSVALGEGGRHILLTQGRVQPRGGTDSAALPGADRRAYGYFMREIKRLARRLRPLWTGDIKSFYAVSEDAFATLARGLYLPQKDALLLQAMCRSSANAYLDRWFESDALKAALAFDAVLGGLSPQETGSALMLVWRAAQEYWGQPMGGAGALTAALEQAARASGASLRVRAGVKSILVEGGRAAGVVLENGLVLRAGAVLSSLDARRTLDGLVPPGGIGFGAAASVPGPQSFSAAKIVFALMGRPPFAGLETEDLRARLILAPRPEAAAEAKGAALAGRWPDEMVAEISVPSIADPGLAPPDGHIVTVFLPFLPLAVEGGWEAQREALRKRVVTALENYAPGFRERIVAYEMLTPDDILSRYGDSSAQGHRALLRLIGPYEARIRTPLPGLYLCGDSSEPVAAVSGSAARVAAGLFLADRREEKYGVAENAAPDGKGHAP